MQDTTLTLTGGWAIFAIACIIYFIANIVYGFGLFIEKKIKGKKNKMTIIINDCNGNYTKTWHNWDRNIVPQVGDILLIHFGDDNEIAQQATVIARVFDGTRPDMVYLTTDYEKDND